MRKSGPIFAAVLAATAIGITAPAQAASTISAWQPVTITSAWHCSGSAFLGQTAVRTCVVVQNGAARAAIVTAGGLSGTQPSATVTLKTNGAARASAICPSAIHFLTLGSVACETGSVTVTKGTLTSGGGIVGLQPAPSVGYAVP